MCLYYMDQSRSHRSSLEVNFFRQIVGFGLRVHRRRMKISDHKSDSLLEASNHIGLEDSLKQNHSQHRRGFRA
jgi:hypothetical protein